MALHKLGESCYSGTVHPVYLLSGNATRDAEAPPVGTNRPAKVSVAALNHEDGSTTFVTVNGWRDRAADVMAVRKGDSLLVIGAFKSREYNGKKYYDLDADFICRSGVDGCLISGEYPTDYGSTSPAFIEEEEEEPGELPF